MTRTNSPAAFSLSIIVALLLTAIIGSSCQSSLMTNGKGFGNVSNLKLSFQLLGMPSSAKSGSTSSKSSPARLLLPTAATLTVTLTPLEAGLAMPAPQTVPVPSSTDAQVLSVSFSGIAWGKYTIGAVASDSNGVAQFQQSSALTVSGDSTAVTLNLLPVNVDTSLADITGGGYQSFLVTLSTATTEAYTYEIPVGALSSGGSIPLDEYELSFSSPTIPCKFYAQDADGSLIMSGMVNVDGTITTAGDTTAMVFIAPSSSFAPSFMTFYSSDTVNPENMTVIINAMHD